jgi:hypothetical protein
VHAFWPIQVVCSSSIYGLSDFPFGIFKLFLQVLCWSERCYNITFNVYINLITLLQYQDEFQQCFLKKIQDNYFCACLSGFIQVVSNQTTNIFRVLFFDIRFIWFPLWYLQTLLTSALLIGTLLQHNGKKVEVISFVGQLRSKSVVIPSFRARHQYPYLK